MFTTILAMFSLMSFAKNNNYQLSSHILEVSKGSPASGVKMKLEQYDEQKDKWSFVDEKITDKNGRIGNFLSSEKENRTDSRLSNKINERLCHFY